MSQQAHSQPYKTQVLRMWIERSTHHAPAWRFSLEDVVTRQRHGFADLDALICYLLELMDELTDEIQSDADT